MAELVGTQKAAALHGIALNQGYTILEQLSAAREALDIYEQEYDQLKAKCDQLEQQQST